MAGGDQLRVAAKNMRAAADDKVKQVQLAERRIQAVRSEISSLQGALSMWRNEAKSLYDQGRTLERQASLADQEEHQMQQLRMVEHQAQTL